MVQWRAILASSLVGEDAVIVLVNSVAENTQYTFEVMFGLLLD